MNNMNANEATHLLTLLEIGSRNEVEHLKELEEVLALSLHSARHFGTMQGLPDSSAMNWQRNWDIVERILNRTRALLKEMAASVASQEADHLPQAMAAWDAIQGEGDLLHEALGLIRTQAEGLNETGRKQWNLLALTLESALEAVHFSAQSLRLKLELQKSHSKEAAEQLVQNFISKLPKRNRLEGSESALYDHEFRNAVSELQREQHQFQGCLEVVKALLMWAETPDTRMRGNRSLSVSN